MSLFRIVKYSSIIFFLGKYRTKLFRVVGVLLFAGITSLLYGDVADYLQRAHPGVVIYALIAKIFIVYGALAFVLWQFRPEPESNTSSVLQQQAPTASGQNTNIGEESQNGPLAALEDVTQKERLQRRYDGVLRGERTDSQHPGNGVRRN